MPKPQKQPDFNWYESESDICTPPEDLTVSQWAEKSIILAGDSAEKGPYRLIRTPYFKPIMNMIAHPNVETLVMVKGAQMGGSYATYAIAFYYCDQEPRPVIIVMADEKTAHKVAERRIHTIAKASTLASKIIRLTKNEMEFLGDVHVDLAWASSVAGLATFSCGLLILDEVDKPGYSVTSKEASAIKLAIERTETYFGRKIIILSTPTTEDGNISKELNSCGAIFDYQVPCPHCGQFQPLRWHHDYALEFPEALYRSIGNPLEVEDVYSAEEGVPMHKLGMVIWEGGSNATPDQIAQAGYVCGKCGVIWTTIEKNNAVEKGKLVSRETIDHIPKKPGIHLWRLLSLLGKSGDIPKLTEDWFSVQADPKDLQGFINSTLGQPWKYVVTTTTEEKILQARCDLLPQIVPKEAIALTAGIDVQLGGFWFIVRAWARDYTSWLIHYGYVTSWLEIETLLFATRYPVQDSSEKFLSIWRAGLDTGGGKNRIENVSMTEQAYLWLASNMVGRGCYVYGCKGSSMPLMGKVKMGSSIDKTPSGAPLPGGMRLIMLDTDRLKDSFHFRLQRAIDHMPTAAYLHSETQIDYAIQILAEEKRLSERGVEEWVQVKKDNHYLDCEVLTHACADQEWPGGGVHLVTPATPRGDVPKNETESFIPEVKGDWFR